MRKFTSIILLSSLLTTSACSYLTSNKPSTVTEDEKKAIALTTATATGICRTAKSMIKNAQDQQKAEAILGLMAAAIADPQDPASIEANLMILTQSGPEYAPQLASAILVATLLIPENVRDKNYFMLVSASINICANIFSSK